MGTESGNGKNRPPQQSPVKTGRPAAPELLVNTRAVPTPVPTPELQEPTQFTRRQLLGALGTLVAAGLGGGYLLGRLTSKRGPLRKRKGHHHTPAGVGPAPASASEKLRSEQLKMLGVDMKAFFEAIKEGEYDEDNRLCDIYAQMLEKQGRQNEEELQIDIFRAVLLPYIEKNLTLSDEEKEMLHQNTYLITRAVGLANMSSIGENLAGGKRQIDPRKSIEKRYKKFREDTDMGQAIATSKKLAEIIDPKLLFALIANETNFVSFYNHAEGVSGAFQFTSMQPPATGLFDLPEDIDEQLKALKTTKDPEKYIQCVTLLRQKHHNEVYGKLDDIQDADIRKQIAMGAGFILGNMDAVKENFGNNERIKNNFHGLMAVAFYNADIARINPNLEKGADLNAAIKKHGGSAFIETLPFFKGSGAGMLYVPRFIVHYEIIDAMHRQVQPPAPAPELSLYSSLIEASLNSNFGLPFKN